MNCPYCIKVCSRCGKLLIANKVNFDKQKSGKYGLRSVCKKCRKEEFKKEYKNNLEKYKEKNKKYYNDNLEKERERSRKKNKEYRKNNPEKAKESSKKSTKKWRENDPEKAKSVNRENNKKYRKNNSDKIRKSRKQYYENNKETIKEKRKIWIKSNPEKIFNQSMRRRQLEENQGNGITKEQWFDMMEFFDWKCAYSDEYIGGDSKYRTVDHIVALNNGGENEIWNLVPMYRNYNSSKNTNNMEEWYIQQEFYSEERLNKIYEWIKYAKEKWGDKK